METFTKYFSAGVMGLVMAAISLNTCAWEKDGGMQAEAKRVVSEFYGNDKIKHAECNESTGHCEVTDITGDRISLECVKTAAGRYACVPK
ncbi:hypothetical protein VSS37_03400 [Candidatus Thiothrix sp. Deng01]|uniref:Lipoprotein n=1 Tax=Candidatus Thiothrix phosphatis TaxID=3112415 RepID=A0ABU6CTU6_9GAMM|nr:hypothetical protein [Candidatus Thiothrix sp. Deng01]MEB4590016.1 hypothetical protein [Candidatus Thiothrix sp. Deng01]